ncbi:MAG: VanW family protein, partial [Clostridia bacterium]|nr:VanW family protein [Clostridia bacterium]
NAALRAGLHHEDDIDHANHTIISDYIPIGLDATISSKGPDLKLTNPYDTPLYIVSYLNGVEENVTIEIYGSPLIHEEFGPIIYDFSSRRTGTGEAPEYTYIYDTPVAPDGEVIAPGESYRYIKSRGKTTARAYMHILDLEGNELIEKEQMFTATYKAYTGVYYVNDPAPPEPTEEPTPTPDP